MSGKGGSSLLQIEKLISEKNGEIEIRRIFGYSAVIVNGYFQSGTYALGMLAAMLRKLKPARKIKTILIIGLGGGGGVGLLRKRYPGAHIVAIEHDSVMVDIARNLVFKRIKFTPEIIVGDASGVLEGLVSSQRRFDLVILDIFRGGNISPLVASDDFVSLIQKVVSSDGNLAVNFFDQQDRLSQLFEKRFSLIGRAKFLFNRMGVYRQFGLGSCHDPIPEGFELKEQSRVFLTARTRVLALSVIGRDGCLGLRYSFGPLAVDVFESRKVPELTSWRGLRLAVWTPVGAGERFSGWWPVLFSKVGAQIGVAPVTDKYWQGWSAHALRHREKWQEQSDYELRYASLDEFEKAYEESGKLSRSTRSAFMREVGSYLPKNADLVVIRLARDLRTGRDVAGLITIDYPDSNQSCHTVSFIAGEARATSVGYGLIDDWFHRTHKQGLDWLDFGIIWQKADPKEWRHYSDFKRQFGLYLIKPWSDKWKLTVSW